MTDRTKRVILVRHAESEQNVAISQFKSGNVFAVFPIMFVLIMRLIGLCHGYLISLCICVMVTITHNFIEWCIGEPMPVFFYRILQYH